MTKSPQARAERFWRESQAVIDRGSPEELRETAAQLEALAEDPGISAHARPHLFHEAGRVLTLLLDVDADAPAHALACGLRAAQLFKDGFIGGDAAVADDWMVSLSGLTQICARAAVPLGAAPLNSAWLEVDVARELFRGTPRWARLGVAYSNLGIGFLRLHPRQAQDERDISIRDRSLDGFDTALDMLEAGPATEFEHELFVARVNRCTCAALDVVDEAEVVRLAEYCVEASEWLVSVGRAADGMGEVGVNAGCAVLRAMQDGLASFLAPGAGEHRLTVARTAASRVLLAAHPELWQPMIEKFVDPCQVGAGEMTPIDFLLSIEGGFLKALLSEVDEGDTLGVLGAIWPIPNPPVLYRTLLHLGRDELRAQRLASVLLDRSERSRTGELRSGELLAERFGEFVARWCAQPEAPIEEMKSLREALMSDPDSSPEDRLRRVSLVAQAATDAAWRWPQSEVEEALELVRAWSPPAADGDQSYAWPRSKIRLLGRAVGMRPDLLEDLRDEGRGARAMLVSSGPPDAEAIDLYEDASVAEAFALREIGNRDGEQGIASAAAELPAQMAEELERWGAETADAERLISAVTAEVEIEQSSYGKVAREFRSAVAGGSHNDRAFARRLLILIAQRGGELDPETAAAAQDAMRLVLQEVRSGTAPQSMLALVLGLADHPQLSLNLDDVHALIELGLRLEEERALEDVGVLVRLSVLADKYEKSAADRLRRVQASERIARFVFASRESLQRIDSRLCGIFLAQLALDADPARGATFVDRRGRITVALAALIAACDDGAPTTVAAALWGLADLSRLHDREIASAFYAALGKYIATLTPSQLPDPMRKAIRADIAMFSVKRDDQKDEGPEGPAGPWDSQSSFVWRASGFYSIPFESDFDDAELWSEIDQFVADVEASDAADEDLASWILGAAQAASISSRRCEVDKRVARGLTEAALRVARSPRVPQTALSLPLFELSILFAVLIGDESLARSALGSYRAAVNQRILMSPDFATALNGVQTQGAIDRAATEALDRRLGVALDIAESGRVKLLTAMAAGLLPALGEAAGNGESVILLEGFEVLVEQLFDRSVTDPLGVVAAFLEGTAWVDAVVDLVVPWKRVPHVEELDRLSESSPVEVIEEVRRMALADPGTQELLDLSDGGVTLAWALGDLDDPRVAILVGDRLLDGDSEEPPDFADMDSATRDELWAMLPPATRRAFNLRAGNHDRLPDRTRIVVIDCGVDPKVAVQVANGISLGSKAEPAIPAIAPSARLLRAAPVTRSKADVEATVLANPTGDLPGSLIEAAAWSARRDIEPKLLMQAEATVDAFLDALCGSRLVVLSAHGRADRREGATLRLADGYVSVQQLLRLGSEIVAERVILSCCWGGVRSTWISQREALGVVNCLLALGVEEVVAPVEVVPDLSVGIFGAGLARSYEQTSGVGDALLQARLDLARIPPESRAAETERWVCQGVAAGTVLAADQTQVEKAVNGLREIAPAQLVETGQSFGLFGLLPTVRRHPSPPQPTGSSRPRAGHPLASGMWRGGC